MRHKIEWEDQSGYHWFWNDHAKRQWIVDLGHPDFPEDDRWEALYLLNGGRFVLESASPVAEHYAVRPASAEEAFAWLNRNGALATDEHWPEELRPLAEARNAGRAPGAAEAQAEAVPAAGDTPVGRKKRPMKDELEAIIRKYFDDNQSLYEGFLQQLRDGMAAKAVKRAAEKVFGQRHICKLFGLGKGTVTYSPTWREKAGPLGLTRECKKKSQET
jgi:hypothetical protein